jgi:uncharacterized integral membrane protein (TIGR00698 family)
VNAKLPGILLCLVIAVPAWLLGKLFPIIGGPIIAIIFGMIAAPLIKNRERVGAGISFTSKYILQTAVVLLGFGLNLGIVLATGRQSLPIIVCTISTSLIIAYVLQKAMDVDSNKAILIGVGSSICGGSAIAATAPVIHANDEEVAQAMSTIFFFNVLAAIFFPMLGTALGMDTLSGEGFGIFAGTAVNDTSSVTATAATWDSMWNLGTQTLDKAVTVKLTRTLAIIPITVILAWYRSRKAQTGSEGVSVKSVFPMFILYFVIASVITTVCSGMGVPASFFAPLKTLSKFFIVLAMAAIGLNTNLVTLIKKGGKPIFLGACCWIGITVMSLFMQHVMGLW